MGTYLLRQVFVGSRNNTYLHGWSDFIHKTVVPCYVPPFKQFRFETFCYEWFETQKRRVYYLPDSNICGIDGCTKIDESMTAGGPINASIASGEASTTKRGLSGFAFNMSTKPGG